jgi:hypothetical protein
LKILKRKGKTKNLFLLLRLFQKFVRKSGFSGSGILKMNLTHTQFPDFSKSKIYQKIMTNLIFVGHFWTFLVIFNLPEKSYL